LGKRLILSKEGMKVGLITNDQAAELVDTSFLEYTNGIVEEVSRSCFCCNFNGFKESISKISINEECKIIIAESVGSCTDLSSTIIQPLKDKNDSNLIIAPLSVLVDQERLINILEGGTSDMHKSAEYILQKQLEEADIILISKSDRLDPDTIERLKLKAMKEWPMA
jgi:G3E family GTPase